MSMQAIANAIAHNPILLMIPCHRVVGKDHTLKGYATSIERKQKLFSIEGISLDS